MEIHIHYFTGRLCGNVYTYNRYIETSISILGQVRLGQGKICPRGLESPQGLEMVRLKNYYDVF